MFLKYAENANTVRVNMIYNSFYRFGIHLCFVVSPFKKKSTLLHPDDVLYTVKKYYRFFRLGTGKSITFFYCVMYFQELILGNDNDGARPEEILVTKMIKHENYNGK